MKLDYNLAVVRKSNYLVEAIFKLNVNEQRLILMLTASVKKDDQDFSSYVISVRDFAKFLGLAENNSHYQRIADLVVGLQKKILTIVDTVTINNKTKKRIQKINWLSYSAYIQGEGKIELCFHPKLKPYLLNLKERYTTYKLKEVAQLKSRFSVRIYELLKQYESLKKRAFTVTELRKILEITPDQYNPYFNFKNRVILTAQRELKNNSSISFDFKEIKSGKKVEKIIFYIKDNSLNQTNLLSIHDIMSVETSKSELEKLIDNLPEQYRDKQSIIKLIGIYLEKYGYNYVIRNITYTNNKSNAVNPGKNLTKKSNYRNYLKKALEKDFGLAYIEDLEEQQKREKLRKEQQRIKKEEKKKEEERLKVENEIQLSIEKYLAKRSDQETKILEKQALDIMPPKEKEQVEAKKVGWKRLLHIRVKEIIRKELFPTS